MADAVATGGYSALPRQYSASLRVRSDGTLDSGYGLTFGRSDINYNNSTIYLCDGALELEAIPSSFQFGEQIEVDFVVDPDGSIYGEVRQGADVFSFAFGKGHFCIGIPFDAVHHVGKSLVVYCALQNGNQIRYKDPLQLIFIK